MPDLEDEKRRLSDERKFVGKQVSALMDQDLRGWLCESDWPSACAMDDSSPPLNSAEVAFLRALDELGVRYLGSLLTAPDDRWWDSRNPEGAETAYRELGRPWLEAHSDPRVAMEWCLRTTGGRASRESLALAILADDRVRARELAESFLADEQPKRVAEIERFQRWLTEYRL